MHGQQDVIQEDSDMFGGLVLWLLYCNTCPCYYCNEDRVSLDGQVTERECEMFILLVVYQLFSQLMFKTLSNLIVYLSN